MNNQNITCIVSVVMPVYNGAEHLREAIDSILNQTFADFEFLIIDDGSTDETVEIVNEYKDSRIALISNGENKGLIYSLNLGLDIAKGKYIARMDADDISLPNRFEKQVQFLDSNNNFSLLGTAFVFLGTPYEVHHPNYNEEIRIKLFDDGAFAHPSVMMRTSDIRYHKLKYNHQYKHIEDYKLWTDFAVKGLQMANLDDVLLQYRQHPNQISTQKYDEQEESKKVLKLEYLSHYFGDYFTKEELQSIHQYNDIAFVQKVLLLDKLSKQNCKQKMFYPEYFDRYIEILIYRNISDNRTIALKEVLFLIGNKVSLRFLKTIIKIKLKKVIGK